MRKTTKTTKTTKTSTSGCSQEGACGDPGRSAPSMYAIPHLAIGDHACGNAVLGTEFLIETPRIQTGTFDFDWSLGGGLPVWRITAFYGPPSGGKTTQALSASATAQQTCFRCFRHVDYCTCGSGGPLRKGVFWVDSEGDLDGDPGGWVDVFGIDRSRVVFGQPETIEHAFAMACIAARSDDCGLVIIDSLAALRPGVEVDDDDLYSQRPGTEGKAFAKAFRSFRHALNRAQRSRNAVAVVTINQIREKIGVMFGSPETTPGGKARLHYTALSSRFSGVSIDKAERKRYEVDGRVVATRHITSIDPTNPNQKMKVRTHSGGSEYIRVFNDIPDLQLFTGQVDDVASVLRRAKTFGLSAGKGAGPFTLSDGVEFPTLADARAYFREHPGFFHEFKRRIFEAKAAGR